MTAELDKLIDAVVSGALEPTSPHAGLDWKNCANIMMAYHGSLDAAKALQESLIPDHWINDMRSHCGPSCENYVTSVATKIGKKVYAWTGVSKVQSRAWLIAILRAYRAKVLSK